MKQLVALFLIGVLVLVGVLGDMQWAMAHEDHKHSLITEAAAIAVAQKTLIQLTEKDAGLGFGKLGGSWTKVPANNVRLHKNGGSYYIIAATNESESKTLYMLLSSEDGAVYDVNFTGEFQKLK